MSGFKDAVTAIENRMSANWTTTPVKYESVPFKETVAAYVALFIRDGEGNQISLGGSTEPVVHRWPGVIIVQVFVPQDSSIRTAREYADGIGAIFHRAQFSSGGSGVITCRVPSVEMIGVRNGWLQANVTIPFHRDKQY